MRVQRTLRLGAGQQRFLRVIERDGQAVAAHAGDGIDPKVPRWHRSIVVIREDRRR